ncbi:MAG TPA: endonuclease/exonuclease/phosphatase family protein [Thermohalobaculum sp.]|nr:endonuclease/exonuclease/phosphatase family protein [Thermohalobaculum sp.]
MISVATYNIRKSVGTDWRRKPDRILAVIRELDVDVVALQEVDRRFGTRATSLSLAVIGREIEHRPLAFDHRPGSLGWHGNTLLVHTRIRVVEQRGLELPGLEPRGAAMAELEEGGRRVRVVGTHLGLLRNWRRRQARALLEQLGQLAPLPTVVMGDLNEWSMGGCLSEFSRSFRLVESGFSYHSERPFVAFDRIMLTPDWRVEASGVHHSPRATLASDHLPVWARLELAERGAGSGAD